jgi:hypothetical protein
LFSTTLAHNRFPTVEEAAQAWLLNDADIMHEQELAERIAMRDAAREQAARERAAKPTSVKHVKLPRPIPIRASTIQAMLDSGI